MVVCAHQPNYLPGFSVIEKVRLADACIWLDEVEFSKGSYINRNRLSDGTLLTVPVVRNTLGGAIKDVWLAEGNWRSKHVKTLKQRFGESDALRELSKAHQTSYGFLVSLNWRCLRVIFKHYPVRTAHVWQSALSPHDTYENASEKLAAMVHEVGGDVYLSGEGGLKYLDMRPFNERNISVAVFKWGKENHSTVEKVCA